MSDFYYKEIVLSSTDKRPCRAHDEALLHFDFGDMKSLPANPWVRMLAGVGFALLAGELFAVNRAHASCGDYVTVGSHQSEHKRPGHERKPENQPCRHGSGEPGKAPCHGTHCEQNQTPSPAPPTTVPVPTHDWACLLSVPFFTQADPIPFEAWLDKQSRIHRAFLIYHPPRSA